MTLEEIFEQSKECFIEALGLEDEDELDRNASLMLDLGAESLDFLDLTFRLEREFDINIPRGGMEERIRGPLTEEAFAAPDGLLTPAALDRIREVLPEADPAKIAPGLRGKDIVTLFTVETFLRIVQAQLEARDA